MATFTSQRASTQLRFVLNNFTWRTILLTLSKYSIILPIHSTRNNKYQCVCNVKLFIKIAEEIFGTITCIITLKLHLNTNPSILLRSM